MNNEPSEATKAALNRITARAFENVGWAKEHVYQYRQSMTLVYWLKWFAAIAVLVNILLWVLR